MGDAGKVVVEAAPVVVEKAAPVPAVTAPLVLDRSIPATPLARRVAAVKGVDLGKVQGSVEAP